MEFFLSNSNVRNQSKRLERLLNIKDNPRAKQKCLKLIARQMEAVYLKYGKKKPRKMPFRQFLDLMNKKSIEYSVKICNDNRRKQMKSQRRTNKNKRYNTAQLGQFSRARDNEIYGNRRLILENRPKHPGMDRGAVSSGAPAYSDGSGMVGHAPYNSNRAGNYTIIDGGISRQPQLPQRKNADVMSQRYAERLEDYGIETNRRGKPQEINFAVDGGDTRGTESGGSDGNTINAAGLDGKGMMGLESNGLNNMATSDGNYESFNNNNKQILNQNNMLNNQQTNNQQMNMVRMFMSMINNNSNGNNGNNNGNNDGNNNEALMRAMINNISNNQNTQQFQQPSQTFNNSQSKFY